MNLYPFQVETASRLIQSALRFGGGINASAPGLGKTITQLSIIKELNIFPVLIVAPKTVTNVWIAEILKFELNLSYALALGTPKQRMDSIMSKPQILITSYDLFRGKYDPLGSKKRIIAPDLAAVLATDWGVVVLDEAHYIGSSSQRSRLTRKLKCKYKFLLTATPLRTSVLNWWFLCEQLPTNPLGKYMQFVWKYTSQDMWGGLHERVDAYQKIARLVAPYVVRKTIEETGLELPKFTEQDIEFELSDKEVKLYSKIKALLLLELEKEDINKLEYVSTLASALVRFIRLQQLVNSMELLGESKTSSKTEALKTIIEGLQGEKVVVFTRFSQYVNLLARDLKAFQPLIITGQTSASDRTVIIQQFNMDPACRVIIGTEALSVGVTLKAQYMINCDQPDSVASYTQRLGRIGGLRNNDPQFIYNLIAKIEGKQTIDGFVRKRLNKKLNASEIILAGDIKELLI